MKVVVIGATGTIGSAVAAALLARGHHVVPVSRTGDPGVDIAQPDRLFATVPDIDAVVCCAASGALVPIDSGTDEEFFTGLRTKLLGQVRLLRRAVEHLPDGGSVTLTAGTFEEPTPGSAFGALTNTGLEAFARTAAWELPRGLRVNVISPGWVHEHATPAEVVALDYVRAVEDAGLNGETLRAGSRSG
ncbi:SDR family oxidoreductase [Amycolatopsis magusensis]|uniref:NAD(P)-dependent dehydrogenase (Short-subunit alcohol dehydrogenase family) n=1 Tax=Amycolatopsis magusensis TaxID=882444 RepID=A0ABS4PRP3_9PSEU|nr:SDR family oxidoreductase [Amycolatopsis magusensis]MBP2181539.1 NAD(P)-dependent dehydrogenase (short-subunit alcohol dehydrogenase family) [Amycolatopsis magusensis]